MLKVFNLLVITIIFALPTLVYADTAPSLTQPNNNSVLTDTSPKLSWSYSGSCTLEGNCFLIEVSKVENFSTTEKSIYTNNTSYSPSLSKGNWFWRVKAKDGKSTWSNFSETNKFILEQKPAPTPNSSSTPLPIQSPNPTASPNPNNENRGATNEKAFTISLDKTTLNSNENITIQITIKNFSPNTTYYLKPSFFQETSTNYFGLTEINGNWIKNSSTATSQYKITTDGSGNWNRSINTKIDPEDSGFKGSGNYNLKVGRYTDAGTGLTWSDVQSTTINYIENTSTNNDNITTQIETPAATTEPEVLGINSEINNELYPEENSEAEEATSSPEITHQIASLSAEIKKDTQHLETIVAGDKKINWWFITSGILLVLTSCAYVVYQRKRMYHA